jgi:hypothetical protein
MYLSSIKKHITCLRLLFVKARFTLKKTINSRDIIDHMTNLRYALTLEFRS